MIISSQYFRLSGIMVIEDIFGDPKSPGNHWDNLTITVIKSVHTVVFFYLTII